MDVFKLKTVKVLRTVHTCLRKINLTDKLKLQQTDNKQDLVKNLMIVAFNELVNENDGCHNVLVKPR